MKRKILTIFSLAFIFSSFTGCGKTEAGTKYEYTDNVIYAEEDTSIKLLNSTETEEELKLTFSIENFDTDDVKVTVYNPENEDITENLECSFDDEDNTVLIKGDTSQVNIAELDLNNKTSLMLKELKNSEFKFLLTNYEEDESCTYIGDVDDFKFEEETEENTENEETSTPPAPARMTSEEIFNLLDGKWESDSKDFTIEFKKNSSGDDYHVTASGNDGYDSDILYADETETEDGEHKIRFVTAGTGHGSCRELLLSDSGKDMSYISGIKKNEEGSFEEVYISMKKK
ncbi:MAG: hypothetical protein Q4D76_13625 [Oscillospiraceae bacterium]|nr:hypothetical protein [Oscillospiraceae bacterium]